MKIHLTISLLATFTCLGQSQISSVNLIDTSIGSAGATEFAFADINQDTNQELLVSFTGSNGKLGYYSHLGNGAFSTLETIDSFPFCRGMALGNFNNDTLIDVVAIGDITNLAKVYINTGSGFATSNLIDNNMPTVLNEVVAYDFDNDSLDDIVIIGQHTIDFYRNLGASGFQKETILSTSTSPEVLECLDLKIADVDNDNDMDLIAGETAGLVVYLNNGNAIFTPQYHSVINEIVDLVLPIHINQDNVIDIVLKNSFGEIKWFSNNGLGSYTFQSVLTTMNLKALSSIDFNNDGLEDIYCSYHNTIAVLLNNASHTFTDQIMVYQDTNLLMGEVNIGNLDNQNGLDYAWSGGNNTIAAHFNLNALSIDEIPSPNKIHLWPNPTNGIIKLNTEAHSIKVFDVAGRKLLETKNQSQLNIEHLKNTLCLIEIKDNSGKTTTHKILKQ